MDSERISFKTWSRYAEAYYNEPGFSNYTSDNRKSLLLKFDSYAREEGLEYIDLKAMIGFRSSLREYKPNTVAQYMKRLSTFCNWLVDMGVLKKTLVPDKLRKKEQYNEAKPILRHEDILRLVGARRPERIWRKTWVTGKAICLLAIASGMRRCELLAVRPVDINAQAGTVVIRSGKGRKGRVASVVGVAMDAVQEYIERARPPEAGQDDPLFCRMVNGEIQALAPSSIERGIKDYIVTSTGREDITLHCLRHSFASQLAAQNVPVIEIMNVLGHSSLAQTDRYLQLIGTPSQAAAHASQAMENVLSPRGWAKKRKDENDPPLFDR